MPVNRSKAGNMKRGALALDVTGQEYKQMNKKASPKSPVLLNCVKAFLIGGLICTLGEALLNLYGMAGLNKDEAGALTSITLVFLSILFTGLEWYDRIAQHAGAGTLVPITGFANAVASPALDFKSEGFVLGLGAKMFVIAGPVIVYGISASVVYGIIYYIVGLFTK